MSAPTVREIEAQGLDFDDLEEISATGTLPIFKSRNVRRRSLGSTPAKPVVQTVPRPRPGSVGTSSFTTPDEFYFASLPALAKAA